MSERERVDWTGRTVRVRVEGPAHGGEFVARHEGRVVFCRGGLTGETVEVHVDDDPGRAFCRGTVVRVLEPSAHRIEPSCRAAAAGAGCCDWSHIDPVAARGFAGTVLAEQAARIGGVDPGSGAVPVDPPAGDDASTGWRTVARLFTGPDGVPGVRRARSHDVITLPCAQLDPRIVEAVASVDLGPGREVLGILGDDGVVHVSDRPEVRQSTRRGGRGSRRGATRARAAHARSGQWRTVRGPETVVRRVGARSWELPPDTFWQAHRSAARHYSGVVGRAVASAPDLATDPVVWDLYGGAGLFSAAVLDVVPGARVTLVESAPGSFGATRDALTSGGRSVSAADPGPAHEPAVRIVRGRVERVLTRGGLREPDDDDADIGDGLASPDVVVLDPPRGGAGIDVMSRLAGLTRTRVVHVGCDAASLARDVGVLTDAGWRLRDLRGVAAFPGTHHVEGLAVLDAPPSARRPPGSP